MEQNNHTNYNANEIQVLEGLEAVKRRPGIQPHDEQRRGQCVGQCIVLRDDAHGLQAAGSGVAGLRV